MKIAVVTGASSGMGMEFARKLARDEKYDEMWLIARRADRLEALCAELERDCALSARAIALDLSDMKSIEVYAGLLKSESPEVSVLVNAAGFGKFKEFTGEPLSEYCSMADTNLKSLIAMTYTTLPYMKRGACIYQIGSLSSFQPVPYQAVYGATKAAVVSFSRAINAELAPKGIHVMTVCPGWVKTEFFDRAVSDNTISYFDRWYTSEQVVIRALRDMKKGKDLSVCGFPVRMQVLMVKHLPHTLVMKIWLKQQKKR